MSDGFFIPAQMSQPRKYTSISQNYLEIKSRTNDGKVLVDGVDVKTLKSDFDNLKSDYQSFKTNHTHYYTWTDEGGSGNTNPPNN